MKLNPLLGKVIKICCWKDIIKSSDYENFKLDYENKKMQFKKRLGCILF